MNWHIEKAGNPIGPFSAVQLKKMAAQGEITPETIVVHDGKRAKASAVKGLLPATPPPLPESSSVESESPQKPDEPITSQVPTDLPPAVSSAKESTFHEPERRKYPALDAAAAVLSGIANIMALMLVVAVAILLVVLLASKANTEDKVAAFLVSLIPACYVFITIVVLYSLAALIQLLKNIEHDCHITAEMSLRRERSNVRTDG